MEALEAVGKALPDLSVSFCIHVEIPEWFREIYSQGSNPASRWAWKPLTFFEKISILELWKVPAKHLCIRISGVY